MKKEEAKHSKPRGGRLGKTSRGSSACCAVGVALILVGLIPLGLGASEIHAAIATGQLYEGTILENDPNIQAITSNAMGLGLVELIFGSILVVAGMVSLWLGYGGPSQGGVLGQLWVDFLALAGLDENRLSKRAVKRSSSIRVSSSKPADQRGNSEQEAERNAPPSLDDLERLALLRDRGIITEDEFQQKKKQILGL